MALALLFSLLRSSDKTFLAGDNPIGVINAFVVDHKLRENSDDETLAVAAELAGLPNVIPHRLALDWGPVPDPPSLPNLETAARRLRYRELGAACASAGALNLFTGHHADDQHETVLMRLLAGHPSRGLAGIRASNDIPECHGIHGIHQSGNVDAMTKTNPPLTFKPHKRDVHDLRKALLSEMRTVLDIDDDTRPELIQLPHRTVPATDDELRAGWGADAGPAGMTRRRPRLAQLTPEHGGVRVYRPLLGFEKERLMATCEAHGVSWVEDYTNEDPGLTARNAVRHMVRDFRLPEALQREAVLRVSGTVRERTRGEEEEAGELLEEMTVEELRTNTGTLAVELPDIEPGEDLNRSRAVAALLARKLLMAVSPETRWPALPTLQGTVSRLFPRLATDAHPTSQPSSFVVAGVLLTRLPSEDGASPRWRLSRAPYPTSQPLPMLHHHQARGLPSYGNLTHPKPHWAFVQQPWRLFDGRFWVRLSLRLAGTITVAPYQPAFASEFRARLSEADRERLDGLLGTYAPGKVRYTIPAVYYDGDVDVDKSKVWIGEGEARPLRRVLGLPSVGVWLPGMTDLVRCDVRYRAVGGGVLEKCGMDPGSIGW